VQEEHLWAKEQLLANFHTSEENGLSTVKAAELLKELGENALTEKASTPWYIALLHEFTSFFALLLWFAGALCWVGYGLDSSAPDNLFLAIILWLVVVITATFSYAQQSKAASLMADFKNFIPKTALCLRDGKWAAIEARVLVPGDIIKLIGGDSIPADCILLSTNEMKVNNASLTGESEDLLRSAEKKVVNVFETPNACFFGTLCTAGAGMGMVFKTGDNTIIGRIANLATSADSSEATLAIEVQNFIKLISALAIGVGLCFLIICLSIKLPPISTVVFCIGIIVACVPEGLMITMTVALALTAKRMAEKFVLVKNM
jgi:sodium/potassium-transporting ATPase subunit alpha